MKKLFFLLSLVLTASVFFSCSSEKKAKVEIDFDDNPRVDQDMTRTSEDTTTVLNITREFLELVKAQKVDEAVSKLYTYNEHDSVSIRPINAEEKKELVSLYSTFPILSYTIDEIRMYSENDTEVFYTTTWFEKPKDSNRPNTLQRSIHPKRQDGKWYLTIEKRYVEPEIGVTD